MDLPEADKAALMVTATLSEDALATVERSKQPPARVYLLVFDGDSSRMVPLKSDGELVLGRDPSNQVVLTDTLVSRRHACITLVDGLATIRDLDSQNGTRVNGETITGTRALVSGDVLGIGSVAISFQTTSRRHARELLNLAQLQEHASNEIERASRFHRPLAMVAITLGLEGQVDRAEIATLVAPHVRGIDAIGWSGSDQLLLVQPETAQVARATAEALLAAVHVVAPRARAGIASWPDDGNDADTLIGSVRSAALAAEPGGVADADRSPSTRAIGDQVVVVADPAMERVYALIERLAKTDMTVLVYGETGTGKELVATAMHRWSARATQPLVSLNCAAITESIVERELFGHEKGAFSGAVATREGLLEAADKGTVFLDEIGELSLAIQAKLLRVIEAKRLTRIGDVEEREIDIRIVAATNRDLEAAIEAGTFRRDLYFRLCGAMVWLPPLRDRRRELPLLAQRFLSDACARIPRAGLVLPSSALQVLASYEWPGNVRELKNVMDFLAATTEDEIDPEHIAARLRQVRPPTRTGETRVVEPPPPTAELPAKTFRPLEEELRELEKRRIGEALAAFGGNQTRAAEAISMPLRTFVNKVRLYNLSPRARR